MKKRFFIEKTAVISAQPHDIYRVLMDIEGWSAWTPSITSMSFLDNDRPVPGVKIKVIQPKLPKAIWTITEVDPEKTLVWEKRSFGLHMLSEHLISADPAGTRVSIRITYEGALAALAYRLLHKLTDRYMTMEINGLKETLTFTK